MAAESYSLEKSAKGGRISLVVFGNAVAFFDCAEGTSGHERLRRRFISWSDERKVWDLKSSISSGIRSCRMRSSSWNRNVLFVVFRFWRAQLKNWSTTKSCTESNVARQTQLHKRTPMRSMVLYSQVVKILMEELFWILSRTCSPSEPSYDTQT